MNELTYIKFYANWIELMETKDTEAKQLAFIKGIFDAYKGDEPPRPQDLPDPHGTDYARRDGYLVARPVVAGVMDKAEAGRLGGQARSDRKANAVRLNGTLGGRPPKTPDCDPSNPDNQSTITKAENLSKNLSKKTKAFKNKNKEEENITLSLLREREREKEREKNQNENQNLPQDAVEINDELPPINRPATVPTDAEMTMMASQMGIPKDYVAEFVEDIKSLGWGYINRGGVFVALNRRNCKAIISSFWNQRQKNKEKSNAEETIGVKIEAIDDYTNRF